MTYVTPYNQVIHTEFIFNELKNLNLLNPDRRSMSIFYSGYKAKKDKTMQTN